MNKKTLSLALAVAAMALVVACGGGGGGDAPAPAAEEAAAPAAPAAGGNGVISGTIAYANGDPDSEIKMDADPICRCMHEHAAYSEKVVADGGGLANVFVYVKSGISGSYTAPAENAVLNQEGCVYTPHVSGIQTGQKLVIRNSDATLHNVHAMPENNPEFNQGQPFQGMELEKTFDTAEVMVPFKCDVHPWMASYIGVMDHPFFAVSGTDGSFSITGLPAGDYEIEAWHEELGSQSLSVSVAADGTAEANFARPRPESTRSPFSCGSRGAWPRLPLFVSADERRRLG
jgi:plastocyanin